MPSPGPLSVLIAGGGVTGLTLAYKLVSAGRTVGGRPLQVTLCEARPRLGGNIQTEQRDGFVIDGGPDAWVVTKPHASALARELGLGERLLGTTAANRRVLVLDGDRLFPFPEGMLLTIPTRVWPFLRTGLLSPLGKLRAGLDLVLPRRARADDESIADFIRRRFGENVLEKLGEPLLGGVYAGDVSALSMRSTFPQLVEMEAKHRSLILGARHAMRAREKAAGGKAGSGRGAPPSAFHSLPGGVAELLDALVKRIEAGGGALRVGVTAARVEQADDGGFVVHVHGPEGPDALRADRVVLATQAYSAADALAGVEPDVASALRAMPYVSSAVAGIAYRRADVAHALDLVGLITTHAARRPMVAITILSSKWAGRAPADAALFRVFFGGHGREEILERSDDALLALAHGELRDLFGVKKDPLFGRVYRHVRASAQPTVGHEARMSRIAERLARRPGLHVAGASMDGVGIPDCVRQAGDLAAKILADRAG